MGQPPVRVGVVDIGTNSMRMLITDGETDAGRWEEVTGLGRGVDRAGVLSADAITRTVDALTGFGEIMDREGVSLRAAMATSASRDSSNREEFFDLAETALGVRPRLISGAEEARYAYAGATAGWDGARPWVVCDIGGGSTEIVTADEAISIDIGSVRATERWLVERPVAPDRLEAARGEVREMFGVLAHPRVGSLLGVGGTWTEMGGLAGGVGRDVDLATVTITEVKGLVMALAAMSVEQTAALPTLNPKRADTILGGVLVADAVMTILGVETVTQSVADTLDGLAMELLAVT
jgi:exopolyphosphatase / guanosine-5'-triphosphate,3'-diphosphate pyrophosphatase